MKVVFMGTPEFAVYSLDAIAERGDEIALVISQEDKARDRGKKIQPPPVKERAIELGIEVFQPKSIKSDEAYEILQKINPDIIVVTAYGQIVPKRILDLPKYGCINVHASLLPKYRGAAPIHYALIDGEQKTGITTMVMAEGLDTGDMLVADEIAIDESDDLKSLHDKLAVLSKKTLTKTLDMIEKGGVIRTEQDDSKSSYASLIHKEMGHIDFSKTPREIINLSRAIPTFAYMEGQVIKLFDGKVGSENISEDYGKIVQVGKDHLEIQAKGGIICFFGIQMPNKKRMRVEDFLKGNKIETSLTLE